MGQVLGTVLAILIAAGIIAAVTAGVCLAGALWLRRIWRRRRITLAIRLNALAVGAAAAGVRWLRTRPRPDVRWWRLQRARRDLLRASSGAEHAVREAKAADVSLGDLESLTRRLRRAALDVDRSLRIAQRSDGDEPIDELLLHSTELTEAGIRIQRAAAASLADAHRQTTGELAHHVAREEQVITGHA